jgi:CheY-like chemotaxis protein
MSEETTTASPPPEASRTSEHAAAPSTPSGGYKLVADVWASLVTLLVGWAWPATVLIVLCLVTRHTDTAAIKKFINDIMQGKQSFEVSAGLKEVAIKIVSLQVQNGLTRQITAESGQISLAEQSAAQRVAESAATKLLQQASQPPELRMKILWVDDHPQNNIGLQYAFQALGMMVVCIDSNSYIASTFATAGRFDVVITDMSRDAVGNKPVEPEAGWQTVNYIKANYPNIPVIIYAGTYSAQHAKDAVSPPVLANTNDTQKVFDMVFDIAAKKLK